MTIGAYFHNVNIFGEEYYRILNILLFEGQRRKFSLQDCRPKGKQEYNIETAIRHIIEKVGWSQFGSLS